jgi:hypothetical protein
LIASVAHAELRYRVVLLRPPVTDDVTADALARVQGELAAAGFEVSNLPHDPAVDVRIALETVGRDLQPIATFAIVREQTTAEIWVCDRIAGKSVIQSVRLDEPAGAGEPSRSMVLAVRAVELLRASLAQYWLPASSGRAARPSADADGGRPVPVAAAVAKFATAGVGLQVGIGWLESAGPVGPVWQPIVRASYGGGRGWAVRLTVAGLGTDATLGSDNVGTASISQELGVLEIVRGFRAGHRVQLLATLGAGGYGARIRGTGVAPYVGRDRDAPSLLTVGGGGVIVTLVPHVALVAEVQALATWPHTVVRLDGVDAGTTAWPSLLLTAGVLATL